jgi:glyoxylase-like metal-dependent hydrolase (beta-lactamase superfamily II)
MKIIQLLEGKPFMTEWMSASDNPDEWHSTPVCDYLRRNGNLNFVREGDNISSSVTVMELSGHTMGLIGLKCGQDTVLCSDAIKNRFELWQDIPLMSASPKESRRTIERIRNEAKFIYPGHDRVLETAKPICDEPLHFTVRYADGREVRV